MCYHKELVWLWGTDYVHCVDCGDKLESEEWHKLVNAKGERIERL